VYILCRTVRVLYGGNDIFDMEVSGAFWHDVHLALISVIIIIILMFLLTSFSVWLTVWGFVTIALSFPLAYFFYRVVFNVAALGMLNGAAAFVVIGIGKTLIAVILIDFFSTKIHTNNGNCVGARPFCGTFSWQECPTV